MIVREPLTKRMVEKYYPERFTKQQTEQLFHRTKCPIFRLFSTRDSAGR
jgi:hypothetical protein